MDFINNAKRLKKLNFLHKTAALVIAGVCIISIMMSGTTAWYDFSQRVTNLFSGSGASQYSAVLTKYEKDVDGNATDNTATGAEFYLYKVNDDGEDTQIGAAYITDENGQISVDGLASGEYYFYETRPADGYTYDTNDSGDVKGYDFTASPETSDENKTIQVTAYNKRLYGNLTISKTAENVDGSYLSEEQKNTQFEFTVTFSDGGTYTYSIGSGNEQAISSGGKIYLTHGQTAVIENLPVGLQYTITETPAKGYTISSKNSAGNIPNGDVEAEFTNTYRETETKTGSLSIGKEVTGDIGDTEKEFEFTVTFAGTGTYQYSVDGGEPITAEDTDTIIITLKHGETAVFIDLPVGLGYTVLETDYSGDGYTATVEKAQGYIIRQGSEVKFNNNRSEEAPETGALTVSKAVTGDGAETNKEFQFTITFDDVGTYQYSIDGGEVQTAENTDTITFALKHGETAEFIDLPVGLDYTVSEDDYSGDGYTASIQSISGTIAGAETARVNVVNEKTIEVIETGTLTVKKVVEGEITEGDRDKAFNFTLIVDDEETKFTLKDGEEKSFEIPVGSTYMVDEDNYYADGYSTSVTNGFGTAAKESITAVVTNTYIGAVTVEISGEKTWNMSADETAELPGSITVYLKNGDTVANEQIVTADDSGSWTYTFTADKYDGEGNEIIYTVDEANIENYEKTIDGYNITNTYVPSEMISFTVTKVWKDDSLDDRPGSVQIQLYRGGSTYGDLISLSAENDWTYTWAGLEADADWTVDEPEVPEGYTKTVTGSAEDGFTITNTFGSAGGDTVIISGQKTWVHGTNPKDNRPDSIIIYIKNGDYVEKQKVITAEDNWSWSFALPKYDNAGNEIKYTIDEANVSGYTKTVNGYNITNEYKKDSSPGSSSNKSDNRPKTGDNFSPLWWLLLAVSGGGLLSIPLYRRKQKRSSR